MTPQRLGALLWYGAAATVVIIGVTVAVVRFPGGYDWAYTVISKLASNRQNPEGGPWLAGSLLVAVLFLWPVSNYFLRNASGAGPRPRFAVALLRLGLVCGALLGLEGVLALEYSRHLSKAHEALALLTFLGFYGGVLSLHLHRIRHAGASLLPALFVVVPLVAAGVTQMALYLAQRDLGWVNTEWRELGVPIWFSFAFWQWIAIVMLATGIGHSIVAGPPPVRGDGPRLPEPAVAAEADAAAR